MNHTPKALHLVLGLALGIGVLTSAAAVEQRASYPTADAAADAFVKALRDNDKVALAKVLGADWKTYIPTDDIDRTDVDRFLQRYDEGHHLDTDKDTVHLEVGKDNWELPLPIVKTASGWQYDMKAAQQEVRTRRIGANELSAQQAMLAYYDAQRDYATEDRDGDKVLQYAQRFFSTPGKHDGLYWTTKDDEPPSPLGPLFGQPVKEAGEGYHGYRYRILTSQGPSAPGGAYDYMAGKRMTNGFALIAWPVKYGETGVMSFMISHDGEIFEKDLGKNGAATAQSIKQFDPDSSWEEVKTSN